MTTALGLGVVGVAALVAGFVGLLWIDAANGTLRAEFVPDTIVWFLVAFVGYIAIVGAGEAVARVGAAAGTRWVDWKWLLVLGLVLRLAMIATEPTLSDDVYRYLWEGHLVTEGVSPYSFTIDSPQAEAYDIEARGLANNTSLASPYLPVAHGLFGATAFVLPSEPWSMQLLMIGFDVMAVAMIAKLLAVANLPERRVLLYWLNPLVIIEVAHGAHIDAIILGIASVGLLWTLDRSRTSPVIVYGAPLMIAAATLTRPLAVLFVPVLFWIWTWRQRAVWAVTIVVPVALAGAAAGFGLGSDAGSNDVQAIGTGVFGSARAYTETFRFNSGIYHWLETWIAGRGLDDKGWNEPMALTRLTVAVLVGLALLGVFITARRARSARGTLRLLAVPVALYVLFTPVLHPWYTLLLLGLVPFLAPGDDERFSRWLNVLPWIALSGLLILSYLTYEDPNAFGERSWVRALEWYPTLGLLAVAAIAAVAAAGGRQARLGVRP